MFYHDKFFFFNVIKESKARCGCGVLQRREMGGGFRRAVRRASLRRSSLCRPLSEANEEFCIKFQTGGGFLKSENYYLRI